MSIDALEHFAEFELQMIALAWMAALYALKIFQLSRLPGARDKAPGKGSRARGVLSAYASAFFPWSMESSRKHIWRWLEFSVYHVGAAAAILTTFSLPFAPGMMTPAVRLGMAVPVAAAVLLGILKLWKRVRRPELRLISTPDDYFSLITLEVFFTSTVIVLLADGALTRVVFFFATAGFLFYVPFSKISHYVYYFFAGVVTGGRYGQRGTRPALRRAE